MKELIKSNEYGIMVLKKDETVTVDSRKVAEFFDKLHKHVLRDIKTLITNLQRANEVGPNLVPPNDVKPNMDSPTITESKVEYKSIRIYKCKYKDVQNKDRAYYQLNQEAFLLLTMGYSTPKAMSIKLWIIEQFKSMYNQLQHLRDCRNDCPLLTDALQRLDSDNPFIYSNEFNMINKIVLGMSTKDFRMVNNIPKGQSIRPWLTDKQLEHIRFLQRDDALLVDMISDYKQREFILKQRYNKLTEANDEV